MKKSHKILAWGCGTVALLLIAAVAACATILSSLAGGEVEPMETICEIEEIPFQTERNGLTIRGTIFLPKDSADSPREVFIMSHGFSEVAANSCTASKSLAQMGIAAVSFDFCGSAPKSTSDGEMKDMTLWSEMADLEAVINHIKTRQWCDTTRIYLGGMSMGGVVTALTSARRSDIAGQILWYPALDRDEQARQNFATDEEIPEETDIFGIKTSRAFWQSFRQARIMDEAQTFQNPTLIIHGTADNLVHYRHSVRLDSLLPRSSLLLIEKAGHGFHGDNFRTAILTTFHFIKNAR